MGPTPIAPTPALLSLLSNRPLACTRARKDFLTGPGLPAIESRAFRRSAPNRWIVLPGSGTTLAGITLDDYWMILD